MNVFVKWHILCFCVCFWESKSSLNYTHLENQISSLFYRQPDQQQYFCLHDIYHDSDKYLVKSNLFQCISHILWRCIKGSGLMPGNMLKILLDSVEWRSSKLLKAEFMVQATAQEINDLKREAYWFWLTNNFECDRRAAALKFSELRCPPVTPRPESSLCHFPHQIHRLSRGKTRHTHTHRNMTTSPLSLLESSTALKRITSVMSEDNTEFNI